MQGLYEYGDILKKPVDVFRLGSGPEKKLEFGNHWHYYAEFLLWKSGNGMISCCDEILDMAPGKLVIIPPLMLHSIIMPEGTGTVVTGIKVNLAWIDLYGDYIPRLDRFFLALKNKVNMPVIWYLQKKNSPELTWTPYLMGYYLKWSQWIMDMMQWSIRICRNLWLS